MSSRRYNNVHTNEFTSNNCEIKYGKFIDITADKIACNDFSADNIDCINLTAHNIATDNLYSENSLLDNTYLKNVYSNPTNTSITFFDDINMNSNYINNISLTTDASNPVYFVKYNLTTKQMSYKFESAPGSIKKYGQFSSNVTQNCPSGTTLALLHELTETSNGPYTQVGNTSIIRFDIIGIYKIGSSIQFRGLSNDHSGLFWFSKNGTYIPRSSSAVFVQKLNDRNVGYAEIITDITSLTDYVQIFITGSHISNNTLEAAEANAFTPPAVTTPNIPSAPSVITTVIEI